MIATDLSTAYFVEQIACRTECYLLKYSSIKKLINHHIDFGHYTFATLAELDKDDLITECLKCAGGDLDFSEDDDFLDTVTLIADFTKLRSPAKAIEVAQKLVDSSYKKFSDDLESAFEVLDEYNRLLIKEENDENYH